MHHPAAFFVRALLCEGSGEAEINEELAFRNLLPLEPGLFGRVQRASEPYPRLDDFEVEDPEVMEWLESSGVYVYFRNPRQMQRSERLLHVPAVRERVERMYLSGMKTEEILPYLIKEPGFSKFTERDLKLFRHYFWNLDLLTRADVVRYIGQTQAQGFHLEALNGGKTSILVRMGLDLNQTDDELHREMFRQLAVRMMMLEGAPYTEATDRRAVALASAGTRIWKNLKTVGTAGMDEAQEKLRRFVEQREPPRIPGVGNGGLLPEMVIDNAYVETDEPN